MSIPLAVIEYIDATIAKRNTLDEDKKDPEFVKEILLEFIKNNSDYRISEHHLKNIVDSFRNTIVLCIKVIQRSERSQLQEEILYR